MAWVRIDDKFTEHKKSARIGPIGIAMQTAAICYANRNLTDGFISKSAASRLLDFEDDDMPETLTWRKIVARLVEAGVWEEAEGGWQIHDYTDYQTPAVKILAGRKDPEEVRAIRQEAGRKGGNAKAAAALERRKAEEAAAASSSKTPSNLLDDDLAQPYQNPSNASSKTLANPLAYNPNVEQEQELRDLSDRGVQGGGYDTLVGEEFALVTFKDFREAYPEGVPKAVLGTWRALIGSPSEATQAMINARAWGAYWSSLGRGNYSAQRFLDDGLWRKPPPTLKQSAVDKVQQQRGVNLPRMGKNGQPELVW